MDIKKLTREVLTKIGIPVTRFCRAVGISSATYYRWLAGDLVLSEQTENRIKNYINQFTHIISNA
jgi:hypothetical protein